MDILKVWSGASERVNQRQPFLLRCLRCSPFNSNDYYYCRAVFFLLLHSQKVLNHTHSSQKVLSTLFAIIQIIIILYNLWRIFLFGYFFLLRRRLFSSFHFFGCLCCVEKSVYLQKRRRNTLTQCCKKAHHCPTDRLTKELLWKRQKREEEKTFHNWLNIIFASILTDSSHFSLCSFIRSPFSITGNRYATRHTHTHIQICRAIVVPRLDKIEIQTNAVFHNAHCTITPRRRREETFSARNRV